MIQEQFIGALSAAFRLSSEQDGGLEWSGVLSRTSLADLGKRLKESVNPEVAETLGDDITAGFNNLVVSLESVQRVLNTSYLRGRALLALGKTEWADIKWRGGAMASKKNLVNTVQLLFTAFDDASTWPAQRQKLQDSSVNHHLVDCSDAHTWSDVTTAKDRLGNCATWMRATPSFGGLVHALTEFDSRVYVGSEPPDLDRYRRAPEKIVDWLEVRPLHQGESMLHYKVDLNPGFVAVIGNKGQGKSALLDVLGRGGNSSRDANFAFLNSRRFLHARNGRGHLYEVELGWRSGQSLTVRLDAAFDPGRRESVEYLPQELIERICNSDPSSQHRDAFESELKRVIFHHLEATERQGQRTLDDLLELRTRSLEARSASLRQEIASLATRYSHLEASAQRLKPEDLQSRLDALYEARDAVHLEIRKLQTEFEATGVSSATSPALQADRDRAAELDQGLAGSRQADEADVELAAQLARRATELEAAVAEVELARQGVDKLNRHLMDLLAAPEPFLTLSVQEERIERAQAEIATEVEARRSAVRRRAEESERMRAERTQVAQRLAMADAARESIRRQLSALEERLRLIEGDGESGETIRTLEQLLTEAHEIPSRLVETRSQLLTSARQMHGLLLAKLQLVRDLYQPAAEFVASDVLAEQAELQFEAELQVGQPLDKLTNALDGRRTAELLDHLRERRVAVDTLAADDVVGFVEQVFDRLTRERGASDGNLRALSLAFRSAVSVAGTLSDFAALDWLVPRFDLTGNGVPLDQLSPGQRGLILLLFYLLVDRADEPLLLDQPEENLDNGAVRGLLVPALKRARARRQIIVVTHNANLAVVGDADQVIVCSRADQEFQVESGSLAGRVTGETTITVLEGSREAFRNRSDKYERVMSR